jgi:ectoine hydroxylase-related dioxygenase (phytanoyl-CoA dioxygenase family)
MKNTLTNQQISNYRRDGFIVIEDFLDHNELEDWRSKVEKAVDLRNDNPMPKGDYSKETDSIKHKKNSDAYFKQRMQLWMDNEPFRKLMFDERIGKMACDLEGIDGIRIWHDQALYKLPYGQQTFWHQDNPLWSFDSNHAISIWIAFDDATINNGCLYFIPGSHSKKYKRPEPGSSPSRVFELNPELISLDTPVPVPMRAGSCSFHNGLTMHGASANMTPGFRRAMTCAFMPDGSTFNGVRNVLPETYFKSLKVGDKLDNNEFLPLIYSRN